MDMKSISQKLQDDIRAIMEAGLHPNQQKIDVHEPEKDKITAHDFKKLRAMKKDSNGKITKEDTDSQIQELTGMAAQQAAVAISLIKAGKKDGKMPKPMKETAELEETKGAPKGHHFTKGGQLKVGDANQDGHGGPMLRTDPKDKMRNKIPPVTEEDKKVVSPFDYKNYKSQIPKKPGELTGHDSKKTSTGTVYTKKPVKENTDIDEARKLEGTYSHSNGNQSKVYKLSGEHHEGDPYHVKLFKAGKHYEPADYFTNDKDDAHSTAKHMVKEDADLKEAHKESKKDFVARQGRLAAAGTETAKDPARMKRMSNIPGYSAAMDLAKKTTKEEVEHEEYTFADYLDAVRTQYGDEDAVLIANEAFKNQDITLFIDQSQSPEA